MTTLNDFGWNKALQEYVSQHMQGGQAVGRVLSIKGFRYYLFTERGELEAELSGNLVNSTAPEDLPRTGDWVAYMDYDTIGYIVAMLPRRNEIARRHPGAETKKQVLAANVDHALIVQSLDRDFNIMRLERYLVQMITCRVDPIVILNKSDLVADQESYRREVQKLKRDCQVYFCSTYTGAGIETLRREVLHPGKTYVLIGSSGVGKSSLLNAFMPVDIQKTSEMSMSTAKGRHTTTTRDLFLLPNGSLVIDTPGTREFGVTFDRGESGSDHFPAIRLWAEHCRFADCKHLGEAGCAVTQAVASGELDTVVYEQYLKLMKEQRRFEINVEDKKRLGKQFAKLTKEAKAHRKKYKY